MSPRSKKYRIGETNINNQGYLMKIIQYDNNINIIVEFQDEYKAKVHTTYQHFLNGKVNNPPIKTGEQKLNNQGCLMKIIEYNNARSIVVEFQDKYKARVHTAYSCFTSGGVRNPYYPSVYNIGIIGNKYKIRNNNQITKEYQVWNSMLQRCYDPKLKEKNPTYKNVTCCDEWLLYENFYNWLHSQENFEQWLNGNRWDLDKDILIKGNKVYSPEACCLVPHNINVLFTKRNTGEFPIGVAKHKNRFRAFCDNQFMNKRVYLGSYVTPEEAFRAYKQYKENHIKQVAQNEYNKGTITKKCYEAIMSYEVEITD